MGYILSGVMENHKQSFECKCLRMRRGIPENTIAMGGIEMKPENKLAIDMLTRDMLRYSIILQELQPIASAIGNQWREITDKIRSTQRDLIDAQKLFNELTK